MALFRLRARDLAAFSIAACFAVAASHAERPALATDRKTFSGTECVAEDGDQQVDIEYVNNRAENERSDAVRTVVCPIVRDDTVHTGGLVAFYAWVRHYGTVEPFSCTVHSRTNTGGLDDTATEETETNAAVQTLNFGSEPSSSVDKASYYLECDIPRVNAQGARSGVNAYQAEEEG